MTSYDAYEMFEHSTGNYSVTLVNTTNGARFNTNQVVCGRQAAYMVARGDKKRAKTLLSVNKMRQGQVVETTLPTECNVNDPLHTHTHAWPLPEVQDALS